VPVLVPALAVPVPVLAVDAKLCVTRRLNYKK